MSAPQSGDVAGRLEQRFTQFDPFATARRTSYGILAPVCRQFVWHRDEEFPLPRRRSENVVAKSVYCDVLSIIAKGRERRVSAPGGVRKCVRQSGMSVVRE